MKKYLIALLALASIAYVIHTRTMTEAEEQPFLDEKMELQQPKQLSFLDRIKQFFMSNGNEEAKIEPAASTENVLQGARPSLKRQSATRSVAPTEHESDEEVTPITPKGITASNDDLEAQLAKEDALDEDTTFEVESPNEDVEMIEDTQEKEDTPEEIEFEEEEELLPAPTTQEETAAPVVDIEKVNLTSPETLLEQEIMATEPTTTAARPEPEIQKPESTIEPVSKSNAQKEIDQFKREAIQGIQ